MKRYFGSHFLKNWAALNKIASLTEEVLGTQSDYRIGGKAITSHESVIIYIKGDHLHANRNASYGWEFE